YRRRPFCGRSERLADIASPDSRRDSRGVPYEFWTIGCWWKSPTAYKQSKGDDAWLITVTWEDFKKLFFLQFFPRAEQ
nr:zinc finger, CCHC-type, retrotransposon Gag domain protein [Tanacetum cinerariifolium]